MNVRRDRGLMDLSGVMTFSFNAASTAPPARTGAPSSVISFRGTLLKCRKIGNFSIR